MKIFILLIHILWDKGTYRATFSERLNSCKQNWKIDGLNVSLGSDSINDASCSFIKNLFQKD